MAQQNSFDIVSQVDRAEVTNAIYQTMKEVEQGLIAWEVPRNEAEKS